MSNFLISLTNHYEENKILATDFACKCKGECYKKLETTPAPAKSAFVGSEYEKENPRILFLSLDPGKEDPKKPELLTPEAVRSSVESGEGLEPKNHHWWWTHVLAAYLLGPVTTEKVRDSTKDYQKEELKRVSSRFAHATAAKCSANKGNKGQAADIFYKNCSQYLSGEIKALAPHVLITQGNYAAKYVNREMNLGKCDQSSLQDIEERQMLWIQTYHPITLIRRNDLWKQQCKKWPEWKSAIDKRYKL